VGARGMCVCVCVCVCEKEEPTLSMVMPAHSARWVMSLFLSRPAPALMQPVTGPSARCFWDVGCRRFEPVPARPHANARDPLAGHVRSPPRQ